MQSFQFSITSTIVWIKQGIKNQWISTYYNCLIKHCIIGIHANLPLIIVLNFKQEVHLSEFMLMFRIGSYFSNYLLRNSFHLTKVKISLLISAALLDFFWRVTSKMVSHNVILIFWRHRRMAIMILS